jgi:hypothetical protein
MLPSAPRCQTSYLKWICDNSKLAMNDTKRNSFVIPEADHSKSLLPPDPFLIVARFNLVSMCGQILAKCGIVHLSTSCQAQFQITQARRMEESCGSKSLKVFSSLLSSHLFSSHLFFFRNVALDLI